MSMTMEERKQEQQRKIAEINKVEGVDPDAFVIDLTDLETGETRKCLPVLPQLAWFRLMYPKGRIAVSVKQVNAEKETYIATARIYVDYKDEEGQFLAEGSVKKSAITDRPEISVIEWAQTSAIGVALRNAGFGLQFQIFGDIMTKKEEGTPLVEGESVELETIPKEKETVKTETAEPPPVMDLATLQEKAKLAGEVQYPLFKYKGQTLNEVWRLDPPAILHLTKKATEYPEAAEAAKILCEYAAKTKSVA